MVGTFSTVTQPQGVQPLLYCCTAVLLHCCSPGVAAAPGTAPGAGEGEGEAPGAVMVGAVTVGRVGRTGGRAPGNGGRPGPAPGAGLVPGAVADAAPAAGAGEAPGAAAAGPGQQVAKRTHVGASELCCCVAAGAAAELARHNPHLLAGRAAANHQLRSPVWRFPV